MRVGADVCRAGGFEHFSGGVAHVLDHGALVFSVGHVDFQDRNAVHVFHLRIDLHKVIPAREDFAEARYVERGARFQKGSFVRGAEAGSLPVEIEAGLTFVAEAAKKFFVRRVTLQIAKTRDVNTYWLYWSAQPVFSS